MEKQRKTAVINAAMTHVQLHFEQQPQIGYIQIGRQETNPSVSLAYWQKYIR